MQICHQSPAAQTVKFLHIFHIHHRKGSSEACPAEILINTAGAKRLEAASQNSGLLESLFRVTVEQIGFSEQVQPKRCCMKFLFQPRLWVQLSRIKGSRYVLGSTSIHLQMDQWNVSHFYEEKDGNGTRFLTCFWCIFETETPGFFLWGNSHCFLFWYFMSKDLRHQCRPQEQNFPRRHCNLDLFNYLLSYCDFLSSQKKKPCYLKQCIHVKQEQYDT